MHEVRNGGMLLNTDPRPKSLPRSASFRTLPHKTPLPPPNLSQSDSSGTPKKFDPTQPPSILNKQRFEVVYVDDLLGRIDKKCRVFETEAGALLHMMNAIIAYTLENGESRMYKVKNTLCVRFDKRHVQLNLILQTRSEPIALE